MPVPIFGLAKAVQMVAAGLERGETPAKIQARLIDTGAADTLEAMDQVWNLGNLAFNASLQLSLGNAEGADRLLSQLSSMGAGDMVVTAKVQVIPPSGSVSGQFVNPRTGEPRDVYRTVQVRVGAGSSAEQIAAAAQEVVDAVSLGSYTALFGEGATYGPLLYYSTVRLP